MAMYLIMHVEEQGEGYYTSPITLTEDWKAWANKEKPGYYFEVYEFINGEFNCIKSIDDYLEEGMALYYWEADEEAAYDAPPHIIKKWVNRTRTDELPLEVVNWAGVRNNCDGEKYDEEDEMWNLIHCGAYTWFDENNRYYVYGSYHDEHYTLGF